MTYLIKTLKQILLASIVLTAFLAASSAIAKQDNITVTLDGAHEAPSNASKASGSGMLTVGDDKTISGSITTKNINGTAAHIHEAAVGVNGPIIVKLNKSGTNSWLVPAGSKLTDEQFASYKAGNLYVNVHSAAIPGGEIRGQIVPQ